MCTVSWMLTSTGHELFANRDERILRAPARGPRCEVTARGKFIAPRDGEAGGTWIAVNEWGLSLCLLNRWSGTETESESERDWRSRGLLVWELADSASRAEALGRIEAADLGTTRSFTLLVLDGNNEPLVRAWDGRALLAPGPESPGPQLPGPADDRTGLLVSGGADPAVVAAARTRAFREGAARSAAVLNRGALYRAFHSAHVQQGAGPCVHDVDVETVSFSHARVTPDQVEFSYAPGPPCTARAQEPLVLARRGARA